MTGYMNQTDTYIMYSSCVFSYEYMLSVDHVFIVTISACIQKEEAIMSRRRRRRSRARRRRMRRGGAEEEDECETMTQFMQCIHRQ